MIPGLKEFVAEYTSDEAMGPDGYLHERGLVVLAPDALKEAQERAKNGGEMATSDLLERVAARRLKCRSMAWPLRAEQAATHSM